MDTFMDCQIVDINNTGILRDKPMAVKLMFFTIDDTQNYPFRRLQLLIETFRH